MCPKGVSVSSGPLDTILQPVDRQKATVPDTKFRGTGAAANEGVHILDQEGSGRAEKRAH